MTPEQFAYWLQGFAEISQKAPTEKEWTIIKDHLATVFNKVTPNRQPYPLGPGISPGPINPINPMMPDPIKPATPNPWPWTNPSPNTSPWTTPNYPRPEIICSTKAPGAGTNWSSGAGTAYSTCEVPNTLHYNVFLNSTQETIRKINKELNK